MIDTGNDNEEEDSVKLWPSICEITNIPEYLQCLLSVLPAYTLSCITASYLFPGETQFGVHALFRSGILTQARGHCVREGSSSLDDCCDFYFFLNEQVNGIFLLLDCESSAVVQLHAYRNSSRQFVSSSMTCRLVYVWWFTNLSLRVFLQYEQ